MRGIDSKRKKKGEIDHKTLLIRNPQQAYSEIDDEIVMLSIEKGEYYNLDKIGRDIWKYLSSTHSFEEIIEFLTETYDVTSAQCEQDVKPFVIELLEKGILIQK